MTKVGGTALSARPLKVSSVGVEGARAGRVVAAHEGLGAGAVSRLPRSRKRTPWLRVALATRTRSRVLVRQHGHQKPQKPTTTKAHAAESNAVPPAVARADAAPAGVGRVRPRRGRPSGDVAARIGLGTSPGLPRQWAADAGQDPALSPSATGDPSPARSGCWGLPGVSEGVADKLWSSGTELGNLGFSSPRRARGRWQMPAGLAPRQQDVTQ